LKGGENEEICSVENFERKKRKARKNLGEMEKKNFHTNTTRENTEY
jgi:hypothetical protein